MGEMMEQARAVVVPQGRASRVSDGDVATAVAVSAGAVLISALLAARWSPGPGHGAITRQYRRLEKAPFNPPDWAFGVWGPLYLGLTVAGARLWNAPQGPARTRALGHWFGIQGLNALWMWLGFRKGQRGAAAVEAAVTVVNAAAFVDAAREVDRPAAWLGGVYAGWVSFAALLAEELWRRNRR